MNLHEHKDDFKELSAIVAAHKNLPIDSILKDIGE